MGYRYLFILLAGVIAVSLHGQVTVSPQFPTADMDITITYDATLGSSQLAGVEAVMMHAGVITAGPQSTAWQYVVGTWGNPDAPGKMTAIGDNKWQITLNPRQYFAVAGLPANQTVYRIGMVFREAGPCGNFGGNSTPCKEGKSPSNSDIFVDLLTSGFEVKLEGIQPNSFWNMGDQLDISALSSAVADLKLEIQKAGVVVWDTTVESTERVDFTYMADQSGAYAVVLTGQRDGETRKDSIPFVVRGVVVEEARPAGLKKGVNFTGAGEVTMVLFAPGKSSVYAVGDFSDWAVDPKYLFKKDGDYFWLRIDGLNESIDYRFQFLVDEYRWLADPYSGIVLDPEDQYIPSSVYPQIPSFPSGARKPDWYHNRLSVIEWPKAPFNWTDQNWQRPAKEELVVYELLIRDFFDFNHRSFQALTDTLDYLKRLGINAIELMPVTEFNGNESWGYNPTFMFALDKAYGTRAQFKTFVNAAHAKGIAVITDVVLNHQDVPGSYLSMFFDYSNFQADAANPWFNVTARHPFNVFWDLNHESLLTQAYVDSVNAYWLREYHLDGFRYDLSKGFTQVNSGDDVSGWSAYDASRVALLKRMADRVWEVQPEAYVILEHFAANNEERELAEYGMMLWGNMNHSFSQLAMGYNAESDVRGTDARFRNWNQRHLISYMESHDEERLMFRNMNYGNANANYSTKSEQVAIDRMKAVSAFFLHDTWPKNALAIW